MQGTNALLIIVAGLLIIYLAVTGRYKCLTGFVACIGGANCSCNDESQQLKTASDILKPLVPLRPLQ